MPASYRHDLTPVFDYRDEVLGRLRSRDTLPAPFEDEPPTRVEGKVIDIRTQALPGMPWDIRPQPEFAEPRYIGKIKL